MAMKAVHVSDVPNLDQVPEAFCSSRASRGCIGDGNGDDRTSLSKLPRKFVVIGHRGCGMNMMQSSDRRMKAIRENSILSFNAAGKFPLNFIEFDVQVTKDDCPVIFHDNFILTEEKCEIIEKRVTDLTSAEFLSYGPQRETKNVGKSLFRKTKDGRIFEWKVENDDPFCTFQEVFQKVDHSLGFNVELKFDDNIIYKEEDLMHILQVVLKVVFEYAKDRPIVFSTFQPDAAQLIRKLQSNYPVFFLTNGGSEIYSDIRRNSLDEAVKLCLAGGLQGIVSEVKAILRNPDAITKIRDSNLSLITYGPLNNVPEVVYIQNLMGVEGVIVDLVEEITEAVLDFMEPVKEGEEENLLQMQRKTVPQLSQHEFSFSFEATFQKKFSFEAHTKVVAVKQLDRNGLQGNREFLVEVLMLSLLHHSNLVNLIGYCADGDQRLLVYEFMSLGSLEEHLHDLPPDKEPLDWNTRMKIAAGAAKGLEHLHDKAKPPVIYRDFKSSNILLDEGYQPKLSDFGLAKLGPTGDKSHVSTRVMGTYGYCAPEYAMTGQLTVKSDVYSFGVVFLELITGRKAIDSTQPHGEQNLVAWARPLFNDRRKFAKLADPRLQGQYPMRSLYQALAVASMCIQEQAAARPLIGDVVTALSYLANQAYDPNTAPGNSYRLPGDKDEKRAKDERGGRILKNEEGGGSGRKWDLEGSERDDSPRETARMLNRDADRERAVAEAKMWGENWREKRRQTQGSFDGTNG